MTFPFVDTEATSAEVPPKPPRDKRKWSMRFIDGTAQSIEAHWMRVQSGMVCFFNDNVDSNEDDILVAGLNIVNVVLIKEDLA